MVVLLPEEMKQSLINCINYPENVISRSSPMFRSTLQSFRLRLDGAAPDLCLVEGQDDVDDVFEVPFRDLATADGKEVDKRNTRSPEDVRRWLGVSIASDPQHPSQTVVQATKRDPKSRFIYIYAENARDQLNITRSSLTQILTYHQVMPIYLEFMLVFGAQSDPRDLRFSGFREQNMMKAPTRGPAIPDLGRSGRHFQMSYNLKGVSFKTKNDDNIRLNEWSIRQAAIYHQFDIVFGTTLWIITKGRLDLQQRYKELTGPDGRSEDKSFDTLEACFRSSLAAHDMFGHWATEDWRWYIRWLEDVIDAESAMAIYGPRGPGHAHREYRPYHIQDLQIWQDKTNEAIMVLESNVEVLGALRRFYNSLLQHADFPEALKANCKDDLATFTVQLDEIISDFQMQASRAKLLANIISDRRELVVQHLQGQAAERTEQLNRNLEREAIVMRIVTIVTLLYLPATFVSTFFGTDIIKYQDQRDGGGIPGEGTFAPVAMKRWLQVTLPLTALTLCAAWATYRYTDTSRQRPGDSWTATAVTKGSPEAEDLRHRTNNLSGKKPLWYSAWTVIWTALPSRISPRIPWGKAPTLPFHTKHKGVRETGQP